MYALKRNEKSKYDKKTKKDTNIKTYAKYNHRFGFDVTY